MREEDSAVKKKRGNATFMSKSPNKTPEAMFSSSGASHDYQANKKNNREQSIGKSELVIT